MTTTFQPRRNAGIPQGGEFAAHQRDAATITLTAPRVSPEAAALARWDLAQWDVSNVTANGEGGKTAHIFLRDYDAKGGYNEIREVEDGAVSFLRDGKLHNENGWALDWRTSNSDPKDYEAYLNGERLEDPDESLGLTFAGRIQKFGGQASVWAKGECEVHVSDNGRIEFFLDGDLHRDGAPALITSAAGHDDDLPDLWFRHGRIINNPLPAAPQRETYGTGDKTFTRVFGSRSRARFQCDETSSTE
jgi:hypothetical protein